MVRSLASSDSSDSDAASLSSLSGDSSVGSAGAVARRARADQLNAERHRENAKQWFKRQTLDGLLQLARPRLVPARVEGLLQDAQLLQRFCDETIPPNDHTWIYSDQVGNSDSPARHRVEQRTQLLLQQSLAPRLRTKETTTFIQRAITTAGGNFYRDFIFLVWPLFTDQDRLEFQTWYYNHDGKGVLPDVPEHVPSASSGIRRENCAAVPRGLLYVPRSVIGRKALNTVKEALQQHPHLTAQYQQAAAQSLQQRQGRTIDACLAEAWRQCTKCLGRGRPLPPAQQELSLRAFWSAKRHLRYCQTLVRHYNAPVIWYVSHSMPTRVRTLLPGSVRRLRPLIQLWRAAISFQKQDRMLRQKVKERKIAKVDHLISVAQEADKRGLSTLHQLLKHLKPKAPKRSIHFRRADGQLMGTGEEMDKLRTFFSELYQADAHTPTPHFLQEALQVESWEITAALHSMPAHKALPPGQVPARLWKLAARSVEAELLQDFNAALQPGELCFPHHWHDSYLALLAKPHKAPNCPSNLRPINLLVAEFKRACTALPKLLACLQSFGMEVSLEKTVALLAIKGPAAAALLKQYTKRVKGASGVCSVRRDNKGADKPPEPASGKGGQVLKDHVESSSKTPGSTSGWNQQHGYRSWPTRCGDKEDLKEVIRAMGRLSLRLQDQLSIFSLDVEFILFLQTDASGNKFSITASLYAAAQQWHRQKESDPASLTQPMRNILLYCLFSALLERLEKLETDPDMMARVRQMGLVEGEAYLFLQWDAAQGKHIKAQVEPLSHREAVESVRVLLRLATFPHVVGRFHALRKLTAAPSGDVIPFTLMAQNRTAESHQLYSLMHRLARNSVWHLIGATMRPTKIGRSPLAKQLDKMIQNL
ncbi:unnamed protein product [Symbiodinium necroappetens]|uniref:Uncharacterized protein n=1 Tax=Symbiodinium necroappetens TaxID=1628268 RepID=A0A812MDP5_9DINO|nr:unnamed protein product [Symbiodinium necroappetens]